MFLIGFCKKKKPSRDKAAAICFQSKTFTHLNVCLKVMLFVHIAWLWKSFVWNSFFTFHIHVMTRTDFMSPLTSQFTLWRVKLFTPIFNYRVVLFMIESCRALIVSFREREKVRIFYLFHVLKTRNETMHTMCFHSWAGKKKKVQHDLQ